MWLIATRTEQTQRICCSTNLPRPFALQVSSVSAGAMQQGGLTAQDNSSGLAENSLAWVLVNHYCTVQMLDLKPCRAATQCWVHGKCLHCCWVQVGSLEPPAQLHWGRCNRKTQSPCIFSVTQTSFHLASLVKGFPSLMRLNGSLLWTHLCLTWRISASRKNKIK